MPVNARATRDFLAISYVGQGEAASDIVFYIHNPDQTTTNIQPYHWQLADLSVRVETNAQYLKTYDHGGYYEAHYHGRELAAGVTMALTLHINF
jgi:hypothetical protein